MSHLLRELLKRDEGFVPHAYEDSLGFLTIGYGRLIDRLKGGRITKDEAEFLLDNDISDKTTELTRKLPWVLQLDEVRSTVLLAMAFQMGTDKLLTFKNTLKAVWDRDYKAAAAGMRASLWYRQTPQRAERLAKAMETGDISALELPSAFDRVPG